MSWFDVQVNGYAGVDFNQDDLTPEAMHRACVRLRADGADGVLATIITEDVAVMERRLARLVRLREEDPAVREVVAGIHIEGPFLNPAAGFRGAHPVDAIRVATVGVAQRLVEAAGGLARIVTLAPEQDPGADVVGYLASQGIVVSAGHTDAGLDTLKAAIQAGLTMFTHVGNGCPMVLPRHDNIVQRALALRRDLWLCFIADGVHISDVALGNYLDLIDGTERCLVTSDAMAAAGLGPGRHRLGRWEVDVGKDLAARAPDGGHLVGSAMSLSRVRERLRNVFGWSWERIDRLTSSAPRLAIGC